MDDLGYEDSDSEEERQSVSDSSGVEIPDIDRLLINPYRWIISRYYELSNPVFSSSLSDDPICNADDCESEDSFVTALDESSTVTEQITSCDCQKCPESSDICCCQHFLKIRQDCHGKEYNFVILYYTLYSVGRSREEVCHWTA